MSRCRQRRFLPGCRPTCRAAPRRLCPGTRAPTRWRRSSSTRWSSWSPRARSGPWVRRAIRARRPTDDLAWIARRAGPRGRGRRALSPRRRTAGRADSRCGPRARPAPDRRQRARRRPARRAPPRARGRAADPGGPPPGRRHRAAAPAAMARPLPDKAIERRLEQSVDPDGGVLDTRQPAPRRGATRGARRAPAPAAQARDAAPRTRREHAPRATRPSRSAAGAT